jgi:hypothetical protein
LSAGQINQIDAFLRAINALDNLRSSIAYLDQAKGEAVIAARQTIAAAMADTGDAIEVLGRGPLDLYPAAVELLAQAQGLERDARNAVLQSIRNGLLQRAATLSEEARAIILQ